MFTSRLLILFLKYIQCSLAYISFKLNFQFKVLPFFFLSFCNMRREGRQHGIVRTYRILPPPPVNPRLVNSATSPSTSALFTKWPSKPTRAHRIIWYGQVHWLRSNDIASSKLLTCRIITGPRSVLSLTGLSDLNGGNGDDCEKDKGGEAEVETIKRGNGHNGDKEDGGSRGDGDYDGSMSFYDVGMMMEHVLDDDEEEDGWCLV
ncbi:hypothetical protein Bca4012_013863 [Brassica carinata]